MNERTPSEGAGFVLDYVVETETFRRVLLAVADRVSPLLIIGPGGTGKTTLLKMLQHDWSVRGGRVCFVRLANIYQESDLFRAFYEQLAPTALTQETSPEPLVISSSADELSESVVTLINSEGPPPLVLLDGLDETLNVHPVLRIVRLLSERTSAVVVLSSRHTDGEGIENIPFHLVNISPLTEGEIQKLLKARGFDQNSSRAAPQLTEIIGGNPLVAELIANYLQHNSAESLLDLVSSKVGVLQLTVRRALERELAKVGDEGKRIPLLRTLAVLAIRGPSIASDLASEDSDVLDLALNSGLVHRQGDTFTIAHSAIASEVLAIASALPQAGTSLRDLEFGAEEAERDPLLTQSFIDPPGIEDLYASRKSIVVGDRGAGKSALFRELARIVIRQGSGIQVIPLEDPAELMLRLEANGSNLATAEQYRAAWLLSIACSLAKHLEFKSPRQKRMAARIRAAVPGGKPDTSAKGRLMSVWRRIRRTSIKFQLGPIVLEPAKAPEASGHSGGAIDIADFLQEAAKGLHDAGKQVIVAVDRIDEVHKYNRDLQEKLVQGLFLAEGSLARTPEIHLLIFIRTDLFQIYDIQEKNKLVSRTIQLHWERDDLLGITVNRILSNRSLAGLADILKSHMKGHFGDALRALFPVEVEGTPFRDWLWQSMENGNGNVSPRQLILLLVLARDAPSSYSYTIEELPVFREEVLRWAMTQLSELSFNEIINDFRVARTFLRNCRAGKLDTFRLADVEQLFDVAEGPTALQVELLEKLGVLERIVVRASDGTQVAKFRIPPLYTRCWTAPNA